jgi:hypothetical protein
MCERGSAPRESAISNYEEGYRLVLSHLACDEDIVCENNCAALREALPRADGTLAYTGHYRDRSLHARDPFFRIER